MDSRSRSRETSLRRLVLACAREITDRYLETEKNPRTGKESVCKGLGWERACEVESDEV